MSKFILIFISALLATACHHRVADYEIQAFTGHCKNKGGVAEINTLIIMTATCGNGDGITRGAALSQLAKNK